MKTSRTVSASTGAPEREEAISMLDEGGQRARYHVLLPSDIEMVTLKICRLFLSKENSTLNI